MSHNVSRKLPELNYDEIKAAAMAIARTGTVPLIWGSPGIGKTSMCQAMAEAMGMKFSAIYLTQRTPPDVGGFILPNRENEKLAFRTRPDFFPPDDEPTLMLFDEILSAHDTVRKAAFEILLERKIGNHRLAPEHILIAATNMGGEDRTSITPMDAPTASRFGHLWLKPDVKSWASSYAIHAGVHPAMIAFLRKNEDLFMERINPVEGETQATKTVAHSPRSWTRVAELLDLVEQTTRRSRAHQKEQEEQAAQGKSEDPEKEKKESKKKQQKLEAMDLEGRAGLHISDRLRVSIQALVPSESCKRLESFIAEVGWSASRDEVRRRIWKNIGDKKKMAARMTQPIRETTYAALAAALPQNAIRPKAENQVPIEKLHEGLLWVCKEMSKSATKSESENNLMGKHCRQTFADLMRTIPQARPSGKTPGSQEDTEAQAAYILRLIQPASNEKDRKRFADLARSTARTLGNGDSDRVLHEVAKHAEAGAGKKEA